MTAKNRELIENWLMFGEARRLKKAGFLSQEDLTRIRMSTPLPKTSSNFLVRAGFFLLGCSLYSSIIGAVSLFLLDAMAIYQYMLLLFAFIGLGIAELLSHNDYHNYGLDDAFIIAFQIVFFGSIGVITESPTVVFFFMTVLGFACCVRYFSTVSMFFSLVGITSFTFTLVSELHLIGMMFLPFLMFVVAVALYFGYRKIKENARVRLYRNSVRLIKIYALVLAYLSMNYLVIREMSEDLMNLSIAPGEDIPFAWVFYLMTFAIPAYYLTIAVQKRDRTFLFIGLLAFAFSVFSIRTYYHVLPLETALILGGIALFLASLYAINRLKNRESGVTFRTDRFSTTDPLDYAQAAIVNSQAHIKANVPSEDPMKFGGGDFSGGGASGKY